MYKYSNQRFKVYVRCAGHCGFCGKELNADTLFVTKLNPKNWRSFRNLMPCCEDCYKKKGSLSVEAYRAKERIDKFYYETVHQYMAKGGDIEPKA